MGDASWRHWCKGDGVSQLQDNASFPPRTSYHVHPDPGNRSIHVNTRSGPQSVNHTQHLPQQLVRSHSRPISLTPASVAKVPYKSATDNICEYFPPPGTRALKPEEGKFDALAKTAGWVPHNANLDGSQRAVYDPVAHKTTMYTFNGTRVSRQEGKGDRLMVEKQRKDAFESGMVWHGRRKGVVEFVDRTHFSAVNQNKDHLHTCLRNPRAYATKTGEMTNWMNNAFESKMKVPFYGKHPHEMNR